jgi:ribosomal protein S19E (S16A)
MRGKVGVNTLRKHYGGNQRNGTNTEHGRKAAGKNIRYSLAQLEAAGLVGIVKYQFEDTDKKVKNVTMGKSLTKKGITDMDRIAAQLVKESKKQ